MKPFTVIATLLILLFTGCEKDDETPITPPATGSSTFTSGNVKSGAVYFSFSAKDSVASSGSWDLKLTTLFAPDDSLRQFPFPGIALNPALGVLGTYVDQKFDLVNPSAVANLTADILDTLAVDSIRSIKAIPVYYSFDKRDTTSADGHWDIKWTVNDFMEPIVMLNTQKGVTGKVLDNTDFSLLSAASVLNLESDVNDTTLVIGNKCFLYAGPPTHRLNPIANRVFVVRTINGARVKFRTLSYYSAAGTSGYPKFEFVAPERYSIGTAALKYSGPPTHKLNPYTDRTFVVKTYDGKFAKFEMLSYYNEAGVSGYMKFKYEVQ
ncbi:MAG: HmuY family protein [Bacteroidota bacterium]